MLRDYLSVDAFKSGIVQYLHKYSYKNTKNEDLWNSMASVSVLLSVFILGMDRFIILFCLAFFTLLLLRRTMNIFYRSESDVLVFGV